MKYQEESTEIIIVSRSRRVFAWTLTFKVARFRPGIGALGL
jgi:hypothetical protein